MTRITVEVADWLLEPLSRIPPAKDGVRYLPLGVECERVALALRGEGYYELMVGAPLPVTVDTIARGIRLIENATPETSCSHMPDGTRWRCTACGRSYPEDYQPDRCWCGHPLTRAVGRFRPGGLEP